MLNKNFEKGITVLEALVATAILGMIAMFFINSSSMFLGSQQTLIKQNKYRQLADLIIKDVSEYVKSEFNPYGKVVVERNIKSGNTVYMEGVDEAPKVGDIFLVAGVGEQFKIVDDPFSPKESTSEGEEGNPVELGNPKKIYVIAVKDEIGEGNKIEAEQKITFISFQKNELTCFETERDLTVDPSALICEQDIKDLLTEWYDMIKADKKITYATIKMSDENLFTVTLGDKINNIVIAKKLPQCAFNINLPEVEEDKGGVVFDFGGNIGEVETGIMVGNENPTHHFIFHKQDHRQYQNMGADPASNVVGHSCEERIDYSTCRQNYAYLNTVTVFLYQYDGTGAVSPAANPSYSGEVWLEASSCSSTFKTPDGTVWDQCEKKGIIDIDHDKDPKTAMQSIDFEKVEPNELSLWFIFSNAGGLNGRGFIGFRTSNLPAGARVLVFDDSEESCYETINWDIIKLAWKCDGGYDWGGKHDGLVLHLDKTVDDINELKDVFLSLTSPSYNIKEWKVLKSGTEDDIKAGWTAACLKAENADDSAFNGQKDDNCWHTIESTFSTLKGNITDSANELTINPPAVGRYGAGNPKHTNQFSPEDGFLRIGAELIAYEEYNAETGKFTGLVRGLFNKVEVDAVNVDGESERIQVACVANMEAVSYPTSKYPEYIKKLSQYNDRANKHLDLRVNDVCETGKKNDDDSKQLSSRSMEMGRWWSWAYNEFTKETPWLEQQVGGDFAVTRDHKYNADSVCSKRPCTGDFAPDDIIYNKLSEKAAHSDGDRVYDGDPVINAPGIFLDRDGTFPALMSSSNDYSDEGKKDKKQLVISVPRKVQLKTSTARLPSTIMSCG